MNSSNLKRVIGDAEEASDELAELFSWAETVDMAYAWATSREGKADHWGRIDLRKLRKVVVGTHFAQTEPWLLKRLHAHASRHPECTFRIVVRGGGTFHPKLVVGSKGEKVRVLMGSSNLTEGGFGLNTELNVLLQLEASSVHVRAFDDFLDQCMGKGEPLDLGWLEAYEQDYRNRPRQNGWVHEARWHFETIDDLDLDWDSYVKALLSQERRPLAPGVLLSLFDPERSYFAELDRMAPVVTERPMFQDWSETERMSALGLKPASGYLGRMKRASMAIHLIRTQPEVVGRFLDEIPRSGPIPVDVFMRVTDGLMDIPDIGIGVATRLLTAIRPDLFLPVNNASQDEVTRLLGMQVKQPKHYFQLMDRVWATPWFRSPRPMDKQQARLWDNRAALLDALLYRP
jgi:hypothetical protein